MKKHALEFSVQNPWWKHPLNSKSWGSADFLEVIALDILLFADETPKMLSICLYDGIYCHLCISFWVPLNAKRSFLHFFSYWRGLLWANFQRVFHSAFMQNFAMPLYRPVTTCKPGFYTIVVVVDVRRTVLPLKSFLERSVNFCASFNSREVANEDLGWGSAGWNGRQICFCQCCIGNLR